MNLAQPITIDRGVPMPPRRSSKTKYPWWEMKPGDWFDWPGTPESGRDACNKRHRYGERYRVAKVTEDGKHMIRIWRVG